MGISLSYNNSLHLSANNNPIIVNSTSLATFAPKEHEYTLESNLPVAQGDELVICTAKHPSEPTMAIFLQSVTPVIKIVNYNSGAVKQTISYEAGEVSCMQFS